MLIIMYFFFFFYLRTQTNATFINDFLKSRSNPLLPVFFKEDKKSDQNFRFHFKQLNNLASHDRTCFQMEQSTVCPSRDSGFQRQ